MEFASLCIILSSSTRTEEGTFTLPTDSIFLSVFASARISFFFAGFFEYTLGSWTLLRFFLVPVLDFLFFTF